MSTFYCSSFPVGLFRYNIETSLIVGFHTLNTMHHHIAIITHWEEICSSSEGTSSPSRHFERERRLRYDHELHLLLKNNLATLSSPTIICTFFQLTLHVLLISSSVVRTEVPRERQHTCIVLNHIPRRVVKNIENIILKRILLNIIARRNRPSS